MVESKGDFIIKKQTMIIKNERKISEVYDVDTGVTVLIPETGLWFLRYCDEGHPQSNQAGESCEDDPPEEDKKHGGRNIDRIEEDALERII